MDRLSGKEGAKESEAEALRIKLKQQVSCGYKMNMIVITKNDKFN